MEQMAQANRIRDARKAKGLTQLQVAQALGIERAAVSQWEKSGPEGTAPARERLAKLAEILDVDVQWLLGGPRKMPVARIPLNENDQKLTTIEQVARQLAPLIPGITTDELAWKIQKWLGQVEADKTETAAEKEPQNNR